MHKYFDTRPKIPYPKSPVSNDVVSMINLKSLGIALSLTSGCSKYKFFRFCMTGIFSKQYFKKAIKHEHALMLRPLHALFYLYITTHIPKIKTALVVFAVFRHCKKALNFVHFHPPPLRLFCRDYQKLLTVHNGLSILRLYFYLGLQRI